MTVEVNGIAHIQMTVNDIKKAYLFGSRYVIFLK